MTNAGWTFPPEFKNSGAQVNMILGDKIIKQSLQILFSTELEDRLYYPDYGCELQKFMFEPITRQLLIFVGVQIKQVNKEYEPRISNISIQIENNDEFSETIYLKIGYFINELSIPGQFNYLINLQPKASV